MTKRIVPLMLIMVLVLLAPSLAGQEKSQITVKNSEVNNGVLIITVQEAQKTFELRCNKGMSGCTAPQPGSYVMVTLPKNWGAYDCTNVELYPGGTETSSNEKIGNYCLITK